VATALPGIFCYFARLTLAPSSSIDLSALFFCLNCLFVLLILRWILLYKDSTRAPAPFRRWKTRLARYGGPISSSHPRRRVSAAGGSAGSASSRAASSSAAGGVGNLLWNSGRTLLPGMMQFFFCSRRGFSSSPARLLD
jgi:hypothetical protein